MCRRAATDASRRIKEPTFATPRAQHARPRVDARLSGGLEVLVIDELASAIQYAVCRFKRVTPELQAQPKFPGGVTAAHTGISDHGGILSRQCMKADLEIPGSFSSGKATIKSSFKSSEPRLTETQSWWPSFPVSPSPRRWAGALQKFL